jgi:hypothetical protein
MDEMLIHFFLVFDKWMTTPTPPLESADGSIVMGCTAPAFPPCIRMCYTALAIEDFLRTMAARNISSGWGAARSMWTFQRTPPT